MLLLSPCRALVKQKPELANYSHFARLFKSQLLQVEFVNPFLPSPYFHYVFLLSFELSLIPCIPFLALRLLSSWSALPLVSTFKPSWPLSCCSFLIVLCILLGLSFSFFPLSILFLSYCLAQYLLIYFSLFFCFALLSFYFYSFSSPYVLSFLLLLSSMSQTPFSPDSPLLLSLFLPFLVQTSKKIPTQLWYKMLL